MLPPSTPYVLPVTKLAGEVGGQEDDHVCDLFRRPEPRKGQLAQRHLVLDRLLWRHVVHLPERLRSCRGGCPARSSAGKARLGGLFSIPFSVSAGQWGIGMETRWKACGVRELDRCYRGYTADQLLELRCECGAAGCCERIQITRSEYEAVTEANMFVVSSLHASDAAEAGDGRFAVTPKPSR